MPEIHNKKELTEFRKSLRSNITKAEVLLWIHLKNSQLEGQKFRRQHSIGKYVLDFYCPSRLLGIEIDGSQHYSDEGKLKDKNREEFLNSLNIRILRFSNNDVLSNLEGVMVEIKKYLPPLNPLLK